MGTALLASCSLLDHESDYLASPSERYFVKSRVNRSNPKRQDYALVSLVLLDKAHQPLDTLNTHAPDVMAWAVGWAGSDTLVVYSPDIVYHAWAIHANKFQLVQLTHRLANKSEYFYQQKYPTNHKNLN